MAAFGIGVAVGHAFDPEDAQLGGRIGGYQAQVHASFAIGPNIGFVSAGWQDVAVQLETGDHAGFDDLVVTEGAVGEADVFAVRTAQDFEAARLGDQFAGAVVGGGGEAAFFLRQHVELEAGVAVHAVRMLPTEFRVDVRMAGGEAQGEFGSGGGGLVERLDGFDGGDDTFILVVGKEAHFGAGGKDEQQQGEEGGVGRVHGESVAQLL